MRWPLQPLQPFQQTQLQPPFGQSVDSLCHPWFTTTNVSYRFPILKLPPPPCAVLLVDFAGYQCGTSWLTCYNCVSHDFTIFCVVCVNIRDCPAGAWATSRWNVSYMYCFLSDDCESSLQLVWTWTSGWHCDYYIFTSLVSAPCCIEELCETDKG